jgi:hypothetical protein
MSFVLHHAVAWLGNGPLRGRSYDVVLGILESNFVRPIAGTTMMLVQVYLLVPVQ